MARKLPISASELALLFSIDEPKSPQPFLIEVEAMVERVLESRACRNSQGKVRPYTQPRRTRSTTANNEYRKSDSVHC